MRIINMTQASKTQIIQAAQILTDSIPIGWPTLQDAMDEIEERLIPENTLFAAIENDIMLGWGGILATRWKCLRTTSVSCCSDKRNLGIGRAP